MSQPVLHLTLRFERDIVLARQRARHIAALLGFEGQDQTRISTAVSEIARNALIYGGGGHVEFQIVGHTDPQLLVVRIADQGPGIAQLEAVLEGRYRSPSGMGVGVLGARRLVDQFEMDSVPGRGTTIVLKKLLPRGLRPLVDADLARITEALRQEGPRDAVEEVQLQNQELLRVLADLTRRQEELSILNRELEDTNRGVVALHSELDEKADHLRRADDIKTRFISNLTHEFRTPVNSIQALTRLLIDRVDGDLNAEQERQVSYIRKAADGLSELVNDLLDLAKVEAGKTVVQPSEFRIAVLFGALRGMLRPLLVNASVGLVFEDDGELPLMHTDEGKVSQILRNLISNALKFTERGEVRISARVSACGKRIIFSVADTGIGIAPEDHDLIFQEFAQVDHPLQRRVRGTGLGLPLCRRLAGLLGGSLSLASRGGSGSVFSVDLPVTYEDLTQPLVSAWTAESGRLPVLFVEDQAETLLLYEKYLSDSRFGMIAARSTREARAALKAVKPSAIVLDLLLAGEDSWGLLTEIKRHDETCGIPVLVVSAVEDRAKANALGADAYLVKPIDRGRLLQCVSRLVAPRSSRRVLIVDDDETFRYVVRQSLLPTPHVFLEARGGVEGLLLAEREMPDLVLLDLAMHDLDGFEVLRRLGANPNTRPIPVVILTSQALDDAQRLRLAAARGVVQKDEISTARLQLVIEDATGVAEVIT